MNELRDGDYFGEIAILYKEQKRIASVIAIDTCEVFRLNRSDFRKILQPHADLLKKMQMNAMTRMEQTERIK